MLLDNLDKEFDCGDGKLSFAGSLYAGNQIFVSLLIAYLIKKHDWRKVSSIGCLLNALGFVLASRATSSGSFGIYTGEPIHRLYLGLFISSFGACAMTHIGNLAVGLYFKKEQR